MTGFEIPLGVVEPFAFGAGLVMLRVAGVLLGLPILANPSVPFAFRALLLVWLSALIYISLGLPSRPPELDPLIGLPLFAGEFLIGAAMGLAARMMLGVAEIAGSLMGTTGGLSVARAFDPVTGSQSNTIGRFLVMAALIVFVGVGGHVAMLGAVIDSYRVFPLGDASALPEMILNLMETATAMFNLAFRLAAPVAVVALVVNVGLGLLVRVAPQLNLFAVGFLVVISVGLLLLYYEIPVIVSGFADAMGNLREDLVHGRFAY